jgi:hypothetical protein
MDIFKAALVICLIDCMEQCDSLQFKSTFSWALVAHAYNPSYSGGRDQEDHGSKPAWANSS